MLYYIIILYSSILHCTYIYIYISISISFSLSLYIKRVPGRQSRTSWVHTARYRPGFLIVWIILTAQGGHEALHFNLRAIRCTSLPVA